MRDAKGNSVSHAGKHALMMQFVVFGLIMGCGPGLQAFGASPETTGTDRRSRDEASFAATDDPGKEILEQRGVALVKTAKWRLGEGVDIEDFLLADGRIVGAAKSGKVVAYDGATGQKKWEKASGGTSITTLQVDGDMVFIRADGAPHAIMALAVADGSEKWALDLPGSRMQLDVKGPRVAVGVNLSEYKPMLGPMIRTATQEAPAGPPELRVFARDTGKLLWTFPLPEGTTQYGGYRLESAGDMVYLFTYRRVEEAGVTALNAADGKMRWAHRIPMGTESATLTLADGFVVMDLAKDAEPPKKGHQKLIVLNATDGTAARQIEVDEALGVNWDLPHGLMLMTRAPLLKHFRTFDFFTTRTLTSDDVKAKFTLWDLKSGSQAWNTAVFLDEKKYDTTSMNVEQRLFLDENAMLVSLEGSTPQVSAATQKFVWSLTLLDLTTGKTLWSNTVENTHATYLNNVQFYKQLILVNSEEGVLALSRTKGQRLWYIPSPSGVWITDNGMLYLQVREPSPGVPAGLYAISLEGNPAANPTSASRP